MAGIDRRALLAIGGSAAAAAALPAPLPAQGIRRPIRLSLNENALGPSPRVAAAIQKAIAGIEHYVEQEEVDALARQIAAFEQVAPEQVVIGEVLEPLGLYLARQRAGGGNFVYSTPGYTALVDAAAPLGGVGKPVPLNVALQNDLPALAAAIDARTLAVSLVNPHNPSATVNPAHALDSFIREASTRTLVVVDEAYLEYDDLPGRSAVRLLREGASVLVFRTLAKAYGLAGLSIGYALAPAPLAESLRKAGIGAPHSLSRIALAAASAAIADQPHIARVRQANVRERARLHAELDRRAIPHSESRANFIFFRPRQVDAARKAFADAEIQIARPFPPLSEWIRVSIGSPAENDRVIDVLRLL